MASTKISQLTEKVTPAGTEELVVNDSGVSKKIKISNLPDNDTTYSVGDGGLTEINFTSADNTKLDGIEASANNYTHPATHSIAEVSGLQTALDGKSNTSHDHTGTYEPAFTKNTGFNKNLGTTAGTVSEGNHNHDSAYSAVGHNHDATYSAISHNHSGVYEPADATIVKDADIGVTIQAYDADTAKTDVAQTFTGATTFTADVNTAHINIAGELNMTATGVDNYFDYSGNTLQIRNPNSAPGYENALKAYKDSTIKLYYNGLPKIETTTSGVTVTGGGRTSLTTDNDGSFDMNASNNFKCTPTANFTLTFTNIASQSGFILLVNTGGHTVSAAATTKVDANMLSTVSTAGTYLLSYFSDGTNVYMTNSAIYT